MYILVSVPVVLALLAVYVARQPAAFRVARSRTFQATPEQLLAMIDDFHSWKSWSPWERLDPSMAREFSGARSGLGARYHWKGNKKVGEGTMEVTARTPDRVVLALEFIAPFAAKNVTTFSCEPAGEGTRLTWAMEGRRDAFVMKLFGALGGMDRLIGRDFDQGLALLEQALEANGSSSVARIAA